MKTVLSKRVTNGKEGSKTTITTSTKRNYNCRKWRYNFEDSFMVLLRLFPSLMLSEEECYEYSVGSRHFRAKKSRACVAGAIFPAEMITWQVTGHELELWLAEMFPTAEKRGGDKLLVCLHRSASQKVFVNPNSWFLTITVAMVDAESHPRPRRTRHDSAKHYDVERKDLELSEVLDVLQRYVDYGGGINCCVCGKSSFPLFCFGLAGVGCVDIIMWSSIAEPIF